MSDNIYYDPEKFGLKIVAEAEFAGNYEFSTHLVFQDMSDRLFYAYDAGCSCPTPFENQTMENLKPVVDMNLLADWVKGNEEYEFKDNTDRAETLLGAFLDKVRLAFRAPAWNLSPTAKAAIDILRGD